MVKYTKEELALNRHARTYRRIKIIEEKLELLIQLLETRTIL